MKTLNSQNTLTGYPIDPRKLILLILFALTSVTMSPQLLGAADSLEPIYQSLQFRQKQSYLDAAPRGDDKPLPEPKLTLTLPRPLIEESDSNLEKVADEKSQELNLDEQRQGQALDQELSQFGYSIFDRAPGTFAPVENMPVPLDYRIGPGDMLIVQLYGKRNVEYQLLVTREGKLLIPEFGPLEVNGLTFSEARDLIMSGFEARVIGARAAVTMGNIRSLQIRMTGDVVAPGTYTVNGLSTLIDALLTSGGIKQSGSLRNISLHREGKFVSRFDLYDILLRGDASNDITLQHNDVIFVPPIGEVVYMGGEVQRPAIYELATEATIDDVIKMAGGLLPTASISNSHIERIVDRKYRTLIRLSEADRTSPIQAGDFVRILPLEDSLDFVVMLSGHVKRPGAYELIPGMRVSDLLPDGQATLRNADLDFALLKREDPNSRKTYVKYLNLADLFRDPGSDEDVLLQSRDQVIVFDLGSNRSEILKDLLAELDIQATAYAPAATFQVYGHARFNGRFPLAGNLNLLAALAISGGVKPGTSLEYGMIIRTEFPSKILTAVPIDLGQAMALPTKNNIAVQPGDRIYLFSDNLNRSALMKADLDQIAAAAAYSDRAPLVVANGNVKHPGRFPLSPGMQVSDLLCATGGLKGNAHGVRAELTRFTADQSGEPELVHIPLDTNQIVNICHSRQKFSRLAGTQALAQTATRKPITVRNAISPVHFNQGAIQIDQQDLKFLGKTLARHLSKEQEVRVVVTGHTDATPIAVKSQHVFKDNLELSRIRATEVAKVIEGHLGLPSKSITIMARGDLEPVSTNSTKEGRAQNRRVEIDLHISPDQTSQHQNVTNAQRLQAPTSLPNNIDPYLLPGDELTFVETPGWTSVARITLEGEVTKPGLYVINRGETLCSVVERAGGLTDKAWPFAAEFTRVSTRNLQQKTLNDIQDQLDDLMVELSLSHSINNQDKTPAGGNKDEFFKVIKQLERAKVSGRQVIDLEAAMTCDHSQDVVLEEGDRLRVPLRPHHVNVAGQVYVPTSHAFVADRSVRDYIELSGGTTVLGRRNDAYAILANGEVMPMKSRGFRRGTRSPGPGAQIYVPLNVDRMNTTEKFQTWTRSLIEVALFAGVIL